MQSGIAGRAIGLGSRLGWVWAGRLASRWMKSLHHHHDGICEITQWNTMSSELCTMALLICCKLFCRHFQLADLCLFLGQSRQSSKISRQQSSQLEKDDSCRYFELKVLKSNRIAQLVDLWQRLLGHKPRSTFRQSQRHSFFEGVPINKQKSDQFSFVR